MGGTDERRHGAARRASRRINARTLGPIGALAVAVSLAAVLGPGCTLVIDGSPNQCEKDADCGPIVPGSVCVQGACVSGDSCSKNADCSSMGQYFVCRQSSPRKCVQLTNDDCTDVEGEWQNDDAVIFGLIAPLDPGDLSTGESILNGARLGISDINSVKLPPKPGSTTPRPVAFVACNDQADNDVSVRAAQHLTSDLGISAICGAAFSGITLDVASKVTIPAGALLMSSSATSNLISDYPDADPACVAACGSDTACKGMCPGLLWRTSPPDSIQGAAIIQYFKDGFEQEVKDRKTGMGGMLPIKVAIAFKGDAYGTGLKEVVESGLQFNGQSALSQLHTNYEVYDYGNPDDPTTDPPKFDDAVVGLTTFQPDVVLVFGTNEAIVDTPTPSGAGIMHRTEMGWTGPIKPFWIFSDGGVIPEMVSEAKADGAGDRTRATAPGTNNVNFQKFESAYSAQFSSDPNGSAEVFGAAGAYDIMYLFSFAAVAAQDKPLTGAEMARGLARTVGGTPIVVGKSSLNQAFSVLSTDAGIDFDGASGPLNWDLSKGEAPSDIVIWCVPNTGTSPIQSGKIYSANQGTITGVFKSACM